jgi:sulfite reductase (NADPH) flavoprotein alpha-component
MTLTVPPPRIELIAPNAPFTPEQRDWLNGFFAGLLALENSGVTALSPEQSAALMPAAPADADDDDAPWHDQAMAIDERMKLAQGRPLRRRLMAAMAQQDCGQCGYNCHDYSEALWSKKEARLNLCVPGGKETNRTLKKLYEEMDAAPAAAPAIVTVSEAEAAAPTTGPSRDAPASASFRSRTRLNRKGSEKETWHIEIDLAGSGIEYTVGDSFGLYAANDPALADAVIRAIGAAPDFAIAGRTLREVLINDVSLSPAPDSLFQLISYITGGERRQKARALAEGEDPDGDAASLDVLAGLEKFGGTRPDPEALIEALEPMQPRLYSISCSSKSNPGAVALTVDAVRYAIGRRSRLGVASTFLSERIKPGDKFKAYVQKAHAFGLPADPSVPIIMVGPGTGIAPFRAFLHERMAIKAPGRNWLFFGHQRRDCDFFYEDELNGLKSAGVLTRLSLAWSRDGKEKFYVQDRMREVGRDLWTWLTEGAHVYVCGDGKHMAKDVERTLVDIVAQHGARTTDEAIAFVADLKRKGRYQQDVY